MKFHTFLLAFAVTAGVAGCSSSETVATVGSDQRGGADQNTGPYVNMTSDANAPDFNKYKTFSWASQVRDENNTTYFLNDLLFKSMVRDAVDHEMASRGYTYSPTGGDVVLNFRVFDQPTEIKTNDNLGNGYWASTETYPYRADREVKLDAGSIIVQMIDRQKGVEVWQGYASGLTDGNVFDKTKDNVYGAVGQIFSKYQYRGDK